VRKQLLGGVIGARALFNGHEAEISDEMMDP